MFGGIFFEFFSGFTILTDVLTEFGLNSFILIEISIEFSWNNNLSIDILTVNRLKFWSCQRSSDRNQSKIWISYRFRSKTPRQCCQKFANLILTEFFGQNPNFDRF